jgi:hypothetical protein
MGTLVRTERRTSISWTEIGRGCVERIAELWQDMFVRPKMEKMFLGPDRPGVPFIKLPCMGHRFLSNSRDGPGIPTVKEPHTRCRGIRLGEACQSGHNSRVRPVSGQRSKKGEKLQLDDEFKAAKQWRLPWWGVLCWIIACVIILWLLDHLGRFDLWRPTLFSIGMLVAAIGIKWKLRRHAWFWVTMAVLSALHFLLVLSVPWTTNWVPAVVIIPIGIADLYAMLWILSVVGRFMEGPKPSRAPHRVGDRKF